MCKLYFAIDYKFTTVYYFILNKQQTQSILKYKHNNYCLHE